MDFLISNAWADMPAAAMPPGEPASPFGSIIMLSIFLALFYFMVVFPQQKKVKEHRKMVGGLVKGEDIVTNGGLLGRVVDVDDTFVTIEIAPNVQVRVQKNAIGAVMPKGTYKGKV